MADRYVTCTCPNCANKINFLEGDRYVTCDACFTNYSAEDLLGSNNHQVGGAGAANLALSAAALIDTSEAAAAYLETFFDSYDWEEYYGVTKVEIDEIAKLVEKNKIKNAVNPTTWVLEFNSIAIPLSKKVEGLAILEARIKEKYTNDIDDNEVIELFDSYRRVCGSLIAEGEKHIKKLENDIKYCEKYQCDAATLSTLKKEADRIAKRIKTLTPVTSVEEIPSVVQLKREKDARYEQELAARGVNAPQIYADAINCLSFSDDANRALELFLQIKGYKDADKHIAKLNRYFNFNSELFNISGKKFTSAVDKKEEETEEQNADTKKSKLSIKKLTPQNYSFTPVGPKTVSLYEVNNLVPSKEPMVKNISNTLCSFGDNIYFIKNGKQLCAYNIKRNAETVLYSTKVGYFNTNKAGNAPVSRYTTSKEQFYIKVKLDLTKAEKKKGCLSGLKDLFKKKQVKEEKELNNYSILLVDMLNVSCKTIIEKTVDITDVYDDKIFYTTAKMVDEEVATTLHVYDIRENITRTILDESCEIHNVSEGKVIYSLWDPTQYNQNLYALDIETNANVLIEKNIYNYSRIINGRVYYTVGNDEYCALFSNSVEGNDRLEIMPNAEDIWFVKNGWMYVNVGQYVHKVSADGKIRIRLARDMQRIVKMGNGYIYYIDSYNDLHIVRADGNNNKILCKDIDGGLIVDDDAIYYLRNEAVAGYGRNAKRSNSLYRLDLEGHNVKKLAFDVAQIANFDESTIYILRNCTRTYEVTTPTSAKDFVTTYETRNLKVYYAFNKATEEFEELLILGLPVGESKEFKSGCFKKAKKLEVTYKEVPLKIKYERVGIAKAGQTSDEHDEEVAAAQQAAQANKNKQLGCGNLNASNQKQAPKANNAKANNPGCSQGKK